MSSKIISLESLSLMDHDENLNDGSTFMTTRFISVGHPYDEPHSKIVWDGSYKKTVDRHSDRDVVSIELVESLVDSDGCAYFVKLKDGNELRLPVRAFISETKEVSDDGIR